jgi:glutamate-5-semialdehyde dehydrogenase
VLAGDGVFTVRARVRQADPHLDRGGHPTPPRAG